MYSQIPAPQKRLSKDAVKVWVIGELIEEVIGFAILAVLFYLDYLFEWKEWIGWILISITVLSAIYAIWAIFIHPYVLYKSWRYDVNEEFLQLKSGVWKEKHQLIPMTKIQSVETNQGPILRKYGLYTLSIETTGSSHGIPALPETVAIELRNQIAHLAKIKEVDE